MDIISVQDIMLSIYSKSLSLINDLWIYSTNTFHNNNDPMILINDLISKYHGSDRKLLCNVKEVRNKSAHMGIITSYNVRMLKLLQNQTSINMNSLVDDCKVIVNWVKSHNILPIGSHIIVEGYKEAGYIDEYIINEDGEIAFVVNFLDGTQIICNSKTKFVIL